jgi:hypothetical protein
LKPVFEKRLTPLSPKRSHARVCYALVENFSQCAAFGAAFEGHPGFKKT